MSERPMFEGSRAGRSGRTGRPRRWPRVLLVSLALVLALAVGVGGFYAWRINDAITLVPREDLLPTGDLDTTVPGDPVPNPGVVTDGSTPAEPAEGDSDEAVIEAGIAEPGGGDPNPARPEAGLGAPGSLNYLLLGSDSRGRDRGRSDVLLLAHVPPSHDKVYLISFTRDMWVTIPGRGAAKINAAYAYGGVPLTVRTVENLIGTRIDHAVMVNFDGFVGLTDALGGVTVENRHASTSGGRDGQEYSFPRGTITVSGEQALAFVRDRYNLPRGDLDRAERQRAVISGILSKMLSLDVLANPAKFSRVVGQLGAFFVVDSGLTNQVIYETAASMRLGGRGDIVSLQAPLAGFGRSAGGQAINLVDWPRMRRMAEAIRTGTLHTYR